MQSDFAVRLVDGKRYELIGADANDGELRISAERRRVLGALRGRMTWAEWLAAYGGIKSTFNGARTWLRERGLVTFDDEAGTYTRDEFTVGQAGDG